MEYRGKVGLDALKKFIYTPGTFSEENFLKWFEFLQLNHFDLDRFEKIDFTLASPVIFDADGNKFSIDFNENKLNYQKKKSWMKTELLSRAMGAGRAGERILDLTAGLGIDAIFLAQLGYIVTAVERNPLIYLALQHAALMMPAGLKLKFVFGSAVDYLKNTVDAFDVIYLDPMFPEKTKSALPRQEMVLFKNLVGLDEDAAAVLEAAVHYKSVQRIVVKRPVKAPVLGLKPHSKVEGKLVRFDIYGARN